MLNYITINFNSVTLFLVHFSCASHFCDNTAASESTDSTDCASLSVESCIAFK